MSLILDEHRLYLRDEVRIRALARAIDAVVRPGDIVVDLGAGTGILGLLACRAGARRVYAIEEGGMIDLARGIARANGFADRIVHIKGFSTQIDLPERARVVVADQIGRFGFDAGVFEYFADARERFLEPGGVTMPARIALQAAPVECDEAWDRVSFWQRRIEGLALDPAYRIAMNTGHPSRTRPDELLGCPATLCTLDASASIDSGLTVDSSVRVERAGVLHGIAGWFVAELAPGVCMSNGPLAEARIDRQNVFFPVAEAIDVQPEDSVRIAMRIRPADLIVQWTVEVSRRIGGRPEPVARFSQSTLEGMLLPHEDLARTSARFVPRRSPRGDARLTVLELCDGRRPLTDVETEVHRRHPALFKSRDEAAVFVAEVVTRYTIS